MAGKKKSTKKTDNPKPKAPKALADLPEKTAAALARACIADNTRKVYAGALRKFQRSGYPETDEGIAAYLGTLFEEGLAAPCGEQAVAALKFRAKAEGRPSPVGSATMRVLAGYRRRAQGRGRGQVAGLRWAQADRAAEMAEGKGDLRGLRDAAILAVASDALLRISELKALDVGDVDIDEQTVLIRSSKTDQEGDGSVQYLGGPTIDRVWAWLEASRLTEGALFRRVLRGRPVGDRLSVISIRYIISKWGKAAGACGRVSGHSLRVGSAQSLAKAGASLVEMQVAGRWQSPVMPGHYAQGQFAKEGAVARLRYGTEWEPKDPPGT